MSTITTEKQAQAPVSNTKVSNKKVKATKPAAKAKTSAIKPPTDRYPNIMEHYGEYDDYYNYDDYGYGGYDDYDDEEELEYQLARVPADMRAALDPRYMSQLSDFRASCRGGL
jgi:hypothetical protein